MTSDPPDLADFEAEVRAWFAHQDWMPRVAETRSGWGEGSDDVSIFDDLSDTAFAARLAEVRTWQQIKFDAGYVTLSLALEAGGRGWSPAYQRRFNDVEAEFEVPSAGELPAVSVALIAPTIEALGNSQQRKQFRPLLLRMDALACQLFSEPNAGSDLAAIQTKAVRDGDDWLLNGQKVWTSGARFAEWGLAIARSEPESVRHHGLTAFLVPLDAAGVTIRPIRQITGGSSFNEVFLEDVRVADTLRLGERGHGWAVAMTVLGFERDHSTGGGHAVGGQFEDVLAAARHFGCAADPAIREALADLYVHARIEQYTNRRAAAKAKAGQPLGAEGSITKLLWTQNMGRVSDVITKILGSRIIADTGEWGTFAWTAHVLGAPGYRIAGGSDEIQRNILGERVLGLPREPQRA